MKRLALPILLVVALALMVGPAPAVAAPPLSPPRAVIPATAPRIPSYLLNTARRWLAKPPVKIATKVARKKIVKSYDTYVRSNGTVCEFPFPARFCAPRYGLGQAVPDRAGAAPGVWSWSWSPRREISRPLVIGEVYYLYCWQLGDQVTGIYGSTYLWYRVSNGGYVSDALLFTGTNDVLPNVPRC